MTKHEQENPVVTKARLDPILRKQEHVSLNGLYDESITDFHHAITQPSLELFLNGHYNFLRNIYGLNIAENDITDYWKDEQAVTNRIDKKNCRNIRVGAQLTHQQLITHARSSFPPLPFPQEQRKYLDLSEASYSGDVLLRLNGISMWDIYNHKKVAPLDMLNFLTACVSITYGHNNTDLLPDVLEKTMESNAIGFYQSRPNYLKGLIIINAKTMSEMVLTDREPVNEYPKDDVKNGYLSEYLKLYDALEEQQEKLFDTLTNTDPKKTREFEALCEQLMRVTSNGKDGKHASGYILGLNKIKGFAEKYRKIKALATHPKYGQLFTNLSYWMEFKVIDNDCDEYPPAIEDFLDWVLSDKLDIKDPYGIFFNALGAMKRISEFMSDQKYKPTMDDIKTLGKRFAEKDINLKAHDYEYVINTNDEQFRFDPMIKPKQVVLGFDQNNPTTQFSLSLTWKDTESEEETSYTFKINTNNINSKKGILEWPFYNSPTDKAVGIVNNLILYYFHRFLNEALTKFKKEPIIKVSPKETPIVMRARPAAKPVHNDSNRDPMYEERKQMKQAKRNMQQPPLIEIVQEPLTHSNGTTALDINWPDEGSEDEKKLVHGLPNEVIDAAKTKLKLYKETGRGFKKCEVLEENPTDFKGRLRFGKWRIIVELDKVSGKFKIVKIVRKTENTYK